MRSVGEKFGMDDHGRLQNDWSEDGFDVARVEGEANVMEQRSNV